MIFDPSRDEDPAARQPSARDRWQLAGGIADAYEMYLVRCCSHRGPSGWLSSRYHRKQRPGTDLPRLSRCCPRDDQQPYLQLSHPAARVPPTILAGPPGTSRASA